MSITRRLFLALPFATAALGQSSVHWRDLFEVDIKDLDLKARIEKFMNELEKANFLRRANFLFLAQMCLTMQKRF